MLFPDVAGLLPPDEEAFTHMAVLKRFLCRAVAISGVSCDPDRCQMALTPTQSVPNTVVIAKELWQEYHDQQTHGSGSAAVYEQMFADLEL